jgi:hypothetical protein
MLFTLIEQSKSLGIILLLPRTRDGTAVKDCIVTLAADLITQSLQNVPGISWYNLRELLQ